MQAAQTAREWLRANGYEEVAAMIDEILNEWKAAGKATRRNWWEILAGDKNGQPRIVAGRIFPVIRAVRKRQGLPNCEQSISSSRRQRAPKIQPMVRWLDHERAQ
jgi:hypothetical protein